MLLKNTNNSANSVIGDFYLSTCGKMHKKRRKMIRSHFKIKVNLIVRIFVRLAAWDSAIEHQLNQNINLIVMKITTTSTTIIMMIDSIIY